MTVSPKFKQLLTPEQLAKVVQVATARRVEANWLLAVMFFESRLNPKARNNVSGSVGLIQFTRDKAGVDYKTIGGVQYKLSSIQAMSFIPQMDLVDKYLKEAIGKKTIATFTDLYLAVFFPLAIGKPDNYILQTSGLSASLIAQQNPAFDTNNDKRIEKKEVTDYFRKLYTSWGFDFDKDVNTGAKAIPLVALAAIIGLVFFYTADTVNLILTLKQS